MATSSIGMISAASTTALITQGFTDFSTSALTVLGSVIVIAVGLLVFYWGWRKIRHVAK